MKFEIEPSPLPILHQYATQQITVTGVMTPRHLKMGVDSTHKTSRISNIRQTTDDFARNTDTMLQILSYTFRESY